MGQLAVDWDLNQEISCKSFVVGWRDANRHMEVASITI
jgi:hypothetical protein